MDVMYEIIDKIDGEDIPQLVIVDESVEKEIARKLRENNICVAYIGNDCGCEKGMPDEDIVELGRTLGNVPIFTCDTGFRKYKKELGYDKIIVLEQMGSAYECLRRAKKAGINIEGNILPKLKHFV